MPIPIHPRARGRVSLARTIFAALTSLAPIWGAGCVDDEFRHQVYPAGGTVLLDGKPIADAFVRFHPQDLKAVAIPEGRTGYPIANPSTETAADGSFKLSTYTADDGVPAGEYKVTILPDAGTPGDEPEPGTESDSETAESPLKKPKSPVSSRYRDPAKTPLKATVSPDSDNRFTFELE